ncbi:MAG: glycosyltransferase [Myxococcota bacterium]
MVAQQERLRVMLLLPSLHGGGAERVAVNILNHADRERFDIRIGLLRRSGPYLDDVDRSRVDASFIGERFLDFDQGDAKVYRPASLALRVALTPVNAIAMMRRFRPDVVMSFRKGMSIVAWGAMLLYGPGRPRWIAREGNNTLAVIDAELDGRAARAAVRRLTGRCYRSADRLLTISYEMADALKRDLPLRPDRVRTIHNAVDIAAVQEKSRETVDVPEGRYLVSVGRLEYQKGYDALVRAFAKSDARESHRLVIVGRGSEEGALRSLAKELAVEDRLVLPGWASNPWAYLAHAEAFVLSSRWEGFGNVVIESLACGLPTLVTDCDFGPKEIVQHDESGIVFPTDYVDAMAAAISRVATDEGLRKRLGAAGVERAQDFDVPVIVRRYEDLFLEAAGRSRIS